MEMETRETYVDPNITEQELEVLEIKLLTLEILQLKKNMIQNTIMLGIKLKQVKESLGHGEWIPWLENEVDISIRTAQKFIKIAIEFKDITTKATSHLGSEKLYILTALPKDEREQFIANNLVERMSTRQLTQSVKFIKSNKKANKRINATEFMNIEKPINNITYKILELKLTESNYKKAIKLLKDNNLI